MSIDGRFLEGELDDEGNDEGRCEAEAEPCGEDRIPRAPERAKVEMMVIGFTRGAASRKTAAVESGMPFCRKRRARGTVPHSQIGTNTPTRRATRIDK
jgi:hypothetical protein